MTEIAEPILKRMVGCPSCGRPTGELVGPGQKPTEAYCEDCRALPRPWRVTTDVRGNTVTTWNPAVRMNTDQGYALTPGDMWAEPEPTRPAGMGANVLRGAVVDIDELDEMVHTTEFEEYEPDPYEEYVRTYPVCPCGSATFNIEYAAQGALTFTAYADENEADDRRLHARLANGNVQTDTGDFPIVTCRGCGTEFSDYEDIEVPDRQYRVKTGY